MSNSIDHNFIDSFLLRLHSEMPNARWNIHNAEGICGHCLSGNTVKFSAQLNMSAPPDSKAAQVVLKYKNSATLTIKFEGQKHKTTCLNEGAQQMANWVRKKLLEISHIKAYVAKEMQDSLCCFVLPPKDQK